MQPKFNMEREKKNFITCWKYRNDFTQFQFHSQIEIYGILEGEMDMLVDGKRKTLKAGEFSVALSYIGHDYKTPVASRSFAIVIPPQLCEEFIKETKGKKLKTPFFSDKDLFDKVVNCLDAMSDKNASTVKKNALVNVVLGLILENGEFIDANSSQNSELISKILFYLNENYKQNITPVTVAQYFGYSQSYISRYFKACCGVNLVKYLTMLRLRNALMLMHEFNHNISYCAMESGFSSVRTFYRSFQLEFGCSPKEYIEKMNHNHR